MVEVEKVLQTSGMMPDQLSETWLRLDGLSLKKPEVELEKISLSKKQLKSKMLHLHTLEECKEVSRQLSLTSQSHLDVSEMNLGVGALLNRLIETRLLLVTRKSEPEQSEFKETIARVREASTKCADAARAVVEQQQDASCREYQRWALEEIKKFGLIQNQDKAVILSAFRNLLLPISEPLLERPVAILFNNAFDEDWKYLGDAGRECLAISAATVTKTLPKAVN